ncbi:MAG: prephenate dehydratase [Flavobacteriaceae bacterium]|nr:prephenate dehydratase [Flavobacteriaceae bacterium]
MIDVLQKVAIQGILGSFHHQVALEVFPGLREDAIEECLSFRQLVQGLATQKTQKAVMAIENSIAGAILPNFALIDQNKLHIIGEHYINIEMNLMALKGQSLSDIKEVHSHPMALLQCEEFFRKQPQLKLVESEDTAASAKYIQENKLKNIAAIAGSHAAKLYDLDILSNGINTVKNNQTRFVVLSNSKGAIEKETINKASLKFELEHTQGSLATVLNVMNNCNMNLTKIQSLPNIEIPFQYVFFVDVTFENYTHFEKAKHELEIITSQFKVLGTYKSGNR